MASSLAIGDFSRATHMSIKTLRHYHRVELLEPADVDEFTGHRRYTPDQIPTAQVIKRFRDLDMPIEDIRRVLAPAAAITAVVGMEDVGAWYQGAVGELRGTIEAQDVAVGGPPGGIYDTDLFAHERGRATVFIPCAGAVRPVGRVEALVVPPAELAVIVHEGGHDHIDRAYGALADHVTRHALGVDGPIREYYLAGRLDTPDSAAWRTEIGWPIFQTSRG